MATLFGPSIKLKSEEVSQGQYKITQLEPPPVGSQVVNSDSDDRKEINVELGSFKAGLIQGYYDKKTQEIGVVPTFMGIQGTHYYGGLDTGLGFDCWLVVGRGHVNINGEGKNLVLTASFTPYFGDKKEWKQTITTLD